MTEPLLWAKTINRPDSATIARLRREFAAAVKRAGASPGAAEDATLILGELIANACEHGMLPVAVELRESADGFSIHVLDRGTGFVRPTAPRKFDSLRGRGLEIIEKLGGRIRITKPPLSSVRVRLSKRTHS